MKAAKIVSLALVLILITGLTSCVTATPAGSPEEAAENFLKYFSQKSYNNAFVYVEEYDGFGFDNRDRFGSKKIIDAVAAGMSYEGVKKTDSETPVEVTAKVTTVDLKALYQSSVNDVTRSMLSDVLSQGGSIDADKFKKSIINKIAENAAKGDAPKVTTEVTFKMEETDGSWYIVMDDLTFNNVCGHINEANEWLAEALTKAYSADEVSSSAPEQTVSSEAAELPAN